VPRQLALWPEKEKPFHPREIWEDLDPERKASIVAILATLIRRAARFQTEEEVKLPPPIKNGPTSAV
jgi:hypothetical protein